MNARTCVHRRAAHRDEVCINSKTLNMQQFERKNDQEYTMRRTEIAGDEEIISRRGGLEQHILDKDHRALRAAERAGQIAYSER
jgi:hypothetical protein